MRRMLSMLLLLTAASIAVPATNALASAAPGLQQQFGVRLFDVPVAAAHNPRALRYIIDFVHPGSVIRRRILVLNQETRRAHFAVYPDAARITHGMFVGDSGATRSELTSWTRLQHRTLTLSPGASTLDMVTIRIPRGATRGEHYGVIWVQQAARARTASGTAIKEVNRVGIRIYLDVGRGGAPPTRFVITSLAGHRSPSGQPVVVARVHDTGGLAVDLSGQVRLSGRPRRYYRRPVPGAAGRYPGARPVGQPRLRGEQRPAGRLLARHCPPGERPHYGNRAVGHPVSWRPRPVSMDPAVPASSGRLAPPACSFSP